MNDEIVYDGLKINNQKWISNNNNKKSVLIIAHRLRLMTESMDLYFIRGM